MRATDLPLRVVLDTNVILNALSRKLPYRHVLRHLLSGGYRLYLTSEILLEYEEKVAEFYGQRTAITLVDAFSLSTHVRKIEAFYRFNYVEDLDDNKFVDCAFAANAHFLVSDDRGFRVLRNVDFPKIEVLTLDEFSAFLKDPA